MLASLTLGDYSMLRFAVPFAALLLTLAPASAETDWSKYGSFVSTRCEDRATIADLLEALKGLTFNDGGGKTFANASKVEITSSVTLRATDRLLDCRLRIEALEGNRSNTYNARYVIRIYPDGRWNTQFHPNY